MRVEQAPDAFFRRLSTDAISELQCTQHLLAGARQHLLARAISAQGSTFVFTIQVLKVGS